MKLLLVFLFISISTGAWAKAHKSKASKPLACPVDPVHGGSSKVPVHEFKLHSKEKVLICVPSSSIGEDGKTKGQYLTQYDAYLFNGKKPGRRVLSGSGNTPVRFELRKGQLYEIMHLNVRGTLHELYKEKIVCEKDICKRKEKTCVFNQYHMSPLSPKEYEREKVIYAKGMAQVQEMTESDLAQMSTLALSGRKMAYQFFTEMSPQPIMIGNTVSFYQHMQGLLGQMRAESCLKLQEK